MPVDLTVDKTTRELRIEWADGRKSVYGFDYLSAMCPCANCSEKRLEREKNPLAVLETAGSGHLEPLGIVLVIAALTALIGRRRLLAGTAGAA